MDAPARAPARPDIRAGFPVASRGGRGLLWGVTMNALPADEGTLYEALASRDAAYEGLFFACVRTTGIFCRPTCSARKPRRENVEFVATAQEALLAGYRPCLVCRPLDPPGLAPDWLGALVAEAQANPEEPIRERALRERGLDPDHVRRQFRRHYGMSFSAFQRSLRLGAALAQIRGGAPAQRAASQAGYASESGFREAFERLFGVSPSAAADGAGGAGGAPAPEHLCASWLTTPLGPMLAIASHRGLALLEFADRRSLAAQIDAVRARTRLAVVPMRTAVLERTEREIGEYFAGSRRSFSIPLDPQGTPFDRAVWERLLAIPCGQTRSYAQLACEVGRPGAARAIGRANGANRIAVIIPCHRVIRADGALCGYGGGVERKRWLLDHEQACADDAPGRTPRLFQRDQSSSAGAGSRRRPIAAAKTSA